MALAPFPTTTIDGVDIYAQPSKAGTPRNAWLAVEFQTTAGGLRYGIEFFGGATREIVARRAGNGLASKGGPWHVVETAKHEWRSTPARKFPTSGRTN